MVIKVRCGGSTENDENNKWKGRVQKVPLVGRNDDSSPIVLSWVRIARDERT